jgi:hypothetical protein
MKKQETLSYPKCLQIKPTSDKEIIIRLHNTKIAIST